MNLILASQLILTAGSFDKRSISWEVRQAQHRVGEWIELHLPKGGLSLPNAPVPAETLITLFWSATALLLVAMGWQLYRVVRPHLGAIAPSAHGQVRSASSIATARSVADWVRQAQKWQRQGNYAQACRALYMAMLQRLDDNQQLPLQPSRTDGEYLQLLQSLPKPQPYQLLVKTHEQICFGHTQISLEVFQRCQQAYQEIESS
jgi:hypothetical protein